MHAAWTFAGWSIAGTRTRGLGTTRPPASSTPARNLQTLSAVEGTDCPSDRRVRSACSKEQKHSEKQTKSQSNNPTPNCSAIGGEAEGHNQLCFKTKYRCEHIYHLFLWPNNYNPPNKSIARLSSELSAALLVLTAKGKYNVSAQLASSGWRGRIATAAHSRWKRRGPRRKRVRTSNIYRQERRNFNKGGRKWQQWLKQQR